MLGIFDDERRGPQPIWPNACGTRPLVPLDVVAKSLKWSTLRRFPRLASGTMGHASAATTVLNRP